MADLVNRLSWSNTRQNAYRRCLREYYWRAFGSWGGWDTAKSSPEGRQAYIFTKMKNLPMLVGELVHHSIERVFDAHRRHRSIPTAGETEEHFVMRLRQAWVESKERRWEQSPKNYVHLAEHFYGPQPDHQASEKLRESGVSALRNFFSLELTRKILASPPDSIRSLEKLEQLEVAGNLIHIKIDLAWQEGDVLHLIDWKSGGPEEEVADQLAAYALFANQKWGSAYEKMACYPVYLREPSIGDSCVTPERIERLQNDVELYFAEIRRRLMSDNPPQAALDSFPMTAELWKCPHCFFRKLCERGEEPKP